MCDICGLEVCALTKENKMEFCKCKKPMPWDNGQCSNCGKPVRGGGLV